MHRKIISAALAMLLVSGLASCRKIDADNKTTTSSEAVTTTEAETVPTTATTTAAPTTVTTTAKPTATKKPTTAKKVTTTVKKVITTIVETTEKTTKKLNRGDYRTEETADTVQLKYGVYCSRATTTTYVKLEDGSEEVYDEEVTEVFSRIGYVASYEELLPAAEENKKLYKSEIKKVLEIINSYREDGGLEPLVLDDRLTTIACARAEEIAWSGRHSHYRPNGKFFSSILKDAGIDKGSAGENIGWGYADAESVCEAWKNSETHYENIMNPEFTKVGLGVAADPDSKGKLCWSQLFIDNLE